MDWLYWTAALLIVAGYLQRDRLAAVLAWLRSKKPRDNRLELIGDLLELRDTFNGETVDDDAARLACDQLIDRVTERRP